MNDSGRALKVKKKHEKQWLCMEGVTAIGIGMDNDSPAIIVSYSGNADDIKKSIPSSVDRVPIVFKFSGTINAQDNDFSI